MNSHHCVHPVPLSFKTRPLGRLIYIWVSVPEQLFLKNHIFVQINSWKREKGLTWLTTLSFYTLLSEG